MSTMLTNDMFITVLTWALGVVGTALTACLVWFAMRIVNQLDLLSKDVTGEFHRFDLRLASLEAWRQGYLDKINIRDHNSPL